MRVVVYERATESMENSVDREGVSPRVMDSTSWRLRRRKNAVSCTSHGRKPAKIAGHGNKSGYRFFPRVQSKGAKKQREKFSISPDI